MRSKERIIIIGNGISGNTALEVIQRSKYPFDIMIISEDPYPEYSSCVLPDFISGDISRKEVFLKSLNDYKGIKIRFGEKVIRIDPKTNRLFFDKRNITYDRLILATGGQPILPSIEGINGNGISHLKTLRDAERLIRLNADCIGIIGTGLIGVETAVALSKRGYKVILIGRREWILPRILDKEVGLRVQKILEKRGIEILTGERVKKIIRNGKRIEAIQLEEMKVACDWVVIACGIEPRVEIAKEAGLEIGPLGGIKVNERMETSYPGIYACGDCAEFFDPVMKKSTLQLRWFNAKQMGRVAGLNSIGIKRIYENTTMGWIFKIFGVPVGSVGELSQNFRKDEIEILERDSGGLYIRFLIKEGKISGVQFIGSIEDHGVLYLAMKNHYLLKEVREGFFTFPWFYKLWRYI